MAFAIAHSQPLGRFGYTPFPKVPGFRLDARGFRADVAGSDTFKFDKSLRGFSGYSITDRTALSVGSFVDSCPSQIKFDLRSPGFKMYFPRSIKLGLSSLQEPILSWSDGSVTSGVPTPKSKWLLVSFQDDQPPVLLVFLDDPASLIVRGSAGKWTVSSEPGYKGWVRACLPLGHKRSAAANAAQLGEQIWALREHEEFWIGPGASLENFSVRSDGRSLTAVWTYDKPGIVVPVPLLMARASGYPFEILTGIKTTNAELYDGPVAYSTEPRIAVRFPMVRIPTGRSLTLGPRPAGPSDEPPPFNVARLCKIGLEALLPDRAETIVTAAQSVTDEFYARSRRFKEPYTKIQLPFPASGEGLDVLAAHALVQQARAVGGETSGNEDDPFVQSSMRVDWQSWMVWAEDRTVSRRASAILSVAAALSDDPERRAMGAMLQAGLNSDRALAQYRAARGMESPAQDYIEPLYALREGIYLTGENPFVDSLLSEVRIVSPNRIVATPTRDGVVVKFDARFAVKMRLVFEIGRPVTVAPLSNVSVIAANQYLGRLVVDCRPDDAGECALMLRSPGWTVPLPWTVAPPGYTEASSAQDRR